MLHEVLFKFDDIPLDQKKGVLIDIDDTLYDYHPCHQYAMQQCHIRYNKKLSQPHTLKDFSSCYRKYRLHVTEKHAPRGNCRSRLLAFQAMLESAGLHKPYILALELETTYWHCFMHKMQLRAEAKAFLIKCQQANIQICAVSDMQAHVQIEKLKILQAEPFIQHLVTSDETGAEKPAAIMFQTALMKLKLQPQDVVMIGDHVEKDHRGATAVGIDAYLVKGSNHD